MYFFFFFFFFFFSVLRPFQAFSLIIQTNQSVGGAKTGVPGEKPPDTPASRTWLVSHMNSCPVRGANPHWRDDRMIKSTEVSDLNHSATGAAPCTFCEVSCEVSTLGVGLSVVGKQKVSCLRTLHSPGRYQTQDLTLHCPLLYHHAPHLNLKCSS